MSIKEKELKFSFEVINKLLHYDHNTGLLYWKERTPEMFANELHDGVNASISFNELWANKSTFNNFSEKGYKIGLISKSKFTAHRVAWLLHYGEWPKGQIDHINGIKDDNRIENLRDVSASVNAKNKPMSKFNRSGHNCVYYIEEKKKYRARIKVNGKKVHLGYFKTIEEAAKAVENSKEKYGFTDRHGF